MDGIWFPSLFLKGKKIFVLDSLLCTCIGHVCAIFRFRAERTQ